MPPEPAPPADQTPRSLPNAVPAGASPQPEFDRLAVVTIQGGGLFGLNLLGQLSYLTEQVNIVPVAVAGNSAGSIVAALYWAGYTPWQIRDIFAQMAERKELTDLVGPFVPEHAPYKPADFRKLKDDCELFADHHFASKKPNGIFKQAVHWMCTPCRTARMLWSLYGIRNRVAPHFETRGCFGGNKFIEKIDELIRNGPLLNGRNLPTGQPLEFGDLRRLVAQDKTFFAPALFLTATNVTGRKLEVFNSIDDCYDRVPIAKAVRASAGFPAFFRPVEFKDDRYAGWYADGGVVSNYPAWIFSQAFRVRLLDSSEYRQLATRPWVHFGLRLERGPIAAEPKTEDPKLFISSLARLLLGGEARTDLEERLEGLVTRSFTIQQPSKKQLPPDGPNIRVPKDLLDIDVISPSLVNEMYRLGREESCGPGQLSFTLPERGVIESLLKELIERVSLVLGQNDHPQLLLRSNVFIPHQATLLIRYAVNMNPPQPGTENDPKANNDHDLCLPLGSGLTGACMTTRRPLLCNLQKLGEVKPEVLDGLFGMPAELHGKVRKDRTWLASVPVFDPLASYPRELSTPSQQELPHHIVYTQALGGRTDGAVLGVLNLDACLQYDTFVPVLDPDPSTQAADPRMRAVLHLMAATASEVGERLSRCFARQEAPRT